MKVLYISHHREESGYGRWCKSFLEALKTTDLDITSVAITLGKADKAGKREDITENNSLKNVDVVIQNTLPHFFAKCSLPCIGGAILENTDVEQNIWYDYFRLLDEVWYPHYKLNLFKKEREIPTALNLDKYKTKRDGLKIASVDGTYKFYWIGELSKRKNLSGLIKAYFHEFSSSDPVSLILKVHSETFDPRTCFNEVENLIEEIKRGMKLYKESKYYPRIKIISEFMPEEYIYALHEYCDCFVSSSYGESICYPMLDAIGMNNPVLSTATFATETYAKYGYCSISYSDMKEPCFGQISTFDFYQSSRESWNSFNLFDFARQMRNMYENRPKTNNDLSDFSYKKVGQKIKESLCEVC